MSAALLADAAVGRRVRIVAMRLDDSGAEAWLAAVGLAEGEEVTVLRRAALGGPLHVRLATGGEFAVAREIATKLEVAEPAAGDATHGAEPRSSRTDPPERSILDVASEGPRP